MVESETRRIWMDGEGESQGRPPLELRLYVAGAAPNSLLAESNLRRLLQASGVGGSLEIIDCLAEPLRALRDGILVTPTLVRVSPQPEHTIIGTLNDAAKLGAALGIEGPRVRNGTYD